MKTLRQLWAAPSTDPPGPLRWRAGKERVAAAALLVSPSEPEARDWTQRGVEWVGDNVHLTATWDDGQPHLLTQVLTTPATRPACVGGPPSHANLATRDRLPGPPVGS